MNTTEFLNGLDYDQLKFARNQADIRIKQKEAEEKVALFVISDDMLNYAVFSADQYDSGVDRLCEVIKDFAKRNPGEDVEFKMNKRRFMGSEAEEMLKL